jgi:hypothetical protein
MFNELKSVPKTRDWGTQNKALDAAIERVRSTYPHKFLQPHELKHRRFAHEPGIGIPHESFLFANGPALPAKRIRQTEQ